MKKLLNALLFLGLTAAAILTGIQYAVFTPEAVTAEVLRQVKRGFTGQVKLGGARVQALSSIAIFDLTLSDRAGQTAFVTLKSASLSLDLWGLLAGRIRFSELAIDGLELSLQRAPDGRFTFEEYIPKRTAFRLPRLPVEWLACAAGEADGTQKEDPDGLAIHRVIVRGSRVNYLDAYVPVQIQHIAGALKLDPGQLEILTLRGRAFDRFPVAITGTLALPGPAHNIEVRLDDAPLKPLVAFVPPLSMVLKIAGEQLEGWIGASFASRADAHGQSTEVALKFREMKWISRLMSSTINAPKAEIVFNTKGAGPSLKVDGSAHFEDALIRPASFTQDVPVESLDLNFDTPQPSFARLRGWTAKVRSGTLSGAGYLGWGGRPNFQLTFNIDRIPLPELGLAGPDSAQLARDMRLTLKGSVLPGWIQITAAELGLGASKVVMHPPAAGVPGVLVPDGPTWSLRDIPADFEIDGSDLAKLLGIAGSVKLGGKLAGQFNVAGPIGQLKGAGKLNATRFAIAPAAGGESVALDLEESVVDLTGNQLTLPAIGGSFLNGRLRAQLALSSQPQAPAGARMNFDISDADAVALAKLLGGTGIVQSGTVAMAGLVGSRVNVSIPQPASPPTPSVTGVLASTAVTSATTGTSTRPALPPRASRAPDLPPPGLLFMGNLEARDVVLPMPPALKAGATRGAPNELRLERASARMYWADDALVIGPIQGAGPAGMVSGSVRIEGPGRVSGKVVLASADGRVSVDLPTPR